VPETKVLYFQEEDETVPLLEWLETLVPNAQEKCLARLARLQALGHELRRPEADYLEWNLYELRAKHAGVNYRMLYFFHGKTAVVVSHGFSKQQVKVPRREIRVAVERKRRFEAAPAAHTFRPEF
jgi:phage-related protein